MGDSLASLLLVLQEILKMHRSGTIRLTRFKNRFLNPTSGGWADIVMNLFVLDDPRLHVFELQLVHRQMSVMRQQMGGHADYKVMRAATEITASLQTTQLPQAMQLPTRSQSTFEETSRHLIKL